MTKGTPSVTIGTPFITKGTHSVTIGTPFITKGTPFVTGTITELFVFQLIKKK